MKKYLKAIIACVFCTLVLSSCSPSFPSNSNIVTESESLIKEITSSYLTEISDGTFATEIYKSNFTPNITSKDIAFKQPQAQALMNESMTHMTFEIQGIEKEGNFFSNLFEKRIKANCFVEISVIDIEGMREKINDPSLGYPEFISLIKANDNSLFTKKTIAIKLAYDDTLMKWEIMDNSELMALIMEPYRNIELENPAGKPDTFVAEYIQSLLALDTKKIIDITMSSSNVNWQIEYSESARFFKDNNIDFKIAKTLFQYVRINAQPCTYLAEENLTDKYLEQATTILQISFPDISDDLRSLDHQASLDEIIKFLEKNQTSGKLISLGIKLNLDLDKDTVTWRTPAFSPYHSLVKAIWNTVYIYPYLPEAEEIANSIMEQLTSGTINNFAEFQVDDPKVLEALIEDRSMLPLSSRNELFIQSLLKGYTYNLVSITKSKNASPVYWATYSVSLPDLNLLQKEIEADETALVPLLKSVIEIKLSQSYSSKSQADLYNLYLRYVDYVNNKMASSTLPLQEYQFTIQLYQDFNGSDGRWLINTMSLVKPNLESSFLDFSGSSIAKAAVDSIIAEGVYSEEDFNAIESYGF